MQSTLLGRVCFPETNEVRTVMQMTGCLRLRSSVQSHASVECEAEIRWDSKLKRLNLTQDSML